MGTSTRQAAARVGHRARCAGLAAALVAAMVLLWTSQVAAHTTLIGSDPSPSASLDESPTEIVLEFSEAVEVRGDGVEVFDEHERPFDIGTPTVTASRVSVDLPALSPGTYVVRWRVVSGDSHPVAGAFTFTVGHPDPEHDLLVATRSSDRSDNQMAMALHTTRALSYLAIALLVGTTAALAAWWPEGLTARPMRQVVVSGWGAALVASAVGTVLVGLHAAGASFGDVTRVDTWWDPLRSRSGYGWLARVALVASAGALLLRLADAHRRWWRSLACLLGAGLAVSVAFSGHGATGDAPGLAVVASAVHVVAATVWIGGLLAVVLVARRAPRDLRRQFLRRWSQVAAVTVVVLATSGATQAARRITEPTEVWTTSYGRLVVAKAVLFVVVVGLATKARLLARHPAVDATPLVRRVRLEMAGLVVVAGLTGVLAGTAPPAAPPTTAGHRHVTGDGHVHDGFHPDEHAPSRSNAERSSRP